jgi:hypothetical protein
LSRDSVEGAIAFALWKSYEESLPDTPWRMAKVIAAILRKEGYIANH